MGKIRNKAPWALDVPDHGVVEVDSVIEVSDSAVYNYTASANWEPVDKAATAAHNQCAKDEAAAVAAERGPVAGPEPEIAVEVPSDDA